MTTHLLTHLLLVHLLAHLLRVHLLAHGVLLLVGTAGRAESAVLLRRLLRLRAEMKLPGLAWLDLRVETDAVGRTLFHQRALFHPRGLAGQAYWAAISPFHGVVFGGMQKNVKDAAEAA